MDHEKAIAIPASALATLHIGVEVYIPRVNVMGVLSDFDTQTLYVGGRMLTITPNERIVF